MTISSRSNPLIKELRALSMAKVRRETGTHFIEGEKLVEEALRSGMQIETLLTEEGYDRFAEVPCRRRETVTRDVMEYVCEAKTPQHVCAAVVTEDRPMPERFPEGLLVLLDRVQDAGNVGTIIRSSDAFGAAGVLLTEGCADPYSLKTLRASMGSVYHLPVWQVEGAAMTDRLIAEGFTCICGHLRGSDKLPAIGAKTALVVGNEGRGVSEEIAERCTLYRLPMRGKAESLNAAVFASVMIFRLTEGI